MYRPTQCPRFPPAASFLRCLVLVLAALGSSACPGLPKPVPTPDDTAVLDGGTPRPPAVGEPSECPTGGCDPRTLNARGIYIGTGSQYCLKDLRGRARYCPEAFVHRPDGGVELHARDPETLEYIYQSPLSASRVTASGAEEPVQLRGVRAEQTGLVITYEAGGRTYSAPNDGDVRALRFRFQFIPWVDPDQPLPPHDFVMRLELGSSSSPVQRYKLFFKPAGNLLKLNPSRPEESHCMQGRSPREVSFLGGRLIDGRTAEVLSDSNTTTVSCVSGAIDSCLGWGYTPWSPSTGSAENSEYLFRSCLHAKRAAYFAARGDSTSYTVEGTRIALRDAYGIQNGLMQSTEALWSPRGAECFNPRNRRSDGPPLPRSDTALPQVPLCTNRHLTEFNKLATGRPQSAP